MTLANAHEWLHQSRDTTLALHGLGSWAVWENSILCFSGSPMKVPQQTGKGWAFNETIPMDTSPEQIAIWRRQSPAERLYSAMALSQFLVESNFALFRQRHPSWSERELRRDWARINYGEEVARLYDDGLAAGGT